MDKFELRPTMQAVLAEFAVLLAYRRSVCKRRKVGAVISDAEGHFIHSIGYNGPPSKTLRECSGERRSCGCVHAEINALLKMPQTATDALLIVTLSPCIPCASAIINCKRISRVIFLEDWHDNPGIKLLTEADISCFHLTTVEYSSKHQTTCQDSQIE